MRRRRRAALLLASILALLTGACTGSDRGSSAGGGTQAPATTAAVIAKSSCLQGDEASRAIRFRTPAGASLVGVLLGGGRTGLVLGHQNGSDLCEWMPQARSFARRGYRVLALDFEGFGDSQPGTGPDARLDADVVAAAQELRRRGADRVVLIGSSMGGTAVLAAAARISPPAAAVVSLSGPAEFQGVDAAAALPRLRVPVLFAASADDQPFADDARAMYRAATVRDKRLLVIAGGAHGTSMIEFGPDAPSTLAALEKFIAAHAGT
jgi:pimeloyl-ACP methyl ester carboxylesterase